MPWCRFSPESYQLLDFGQGRKLERFGPYTLDRPCPAAIDVAQAMPPELWRQAAARFERITGSAGVWRCAGDRPEPWTIRLDNLRLELKLTDFGHLGVFPEQAENWEWISIEVARAPKPMKVLNLFAYTGASTLAAAAAGAEVVHVDAARNTVAWARRNAELSKLAGAPIRWIAEDAVTFARRELKRGNRYHAIVLDPPSYGHGPRGETWRLAEQLPNLVQICAALTAGPCRFMLLSCHTPDFGSQELARLLAAALGELNVWSGEMTLSTTDGRRLPSGSVARWSSDRGP